MVDMEEDYMEDYPMDEGDDTDEFEDIENEDENDPDELYERTLEVSLFFKESASFYCVSNFFLLYTQPALRINVACLFALLLYCSIDLYLSQIWPLRSTRLVCKP